MNPRISAALIGMVLAAFGLLAPESKPNPVEAARMNNLGAAYMNQQLFEKGLKHFQEAATLDPNLAIAKLNAGIAFLNLQKVDEAKAALESALKQDPKNPNAWYNLGLLAKNTGDAAAAIDAFKRVTEIDPNDADTWYFLGTAYVQAKQFPPAIEAFQHALQLNPLHASAEFGLSRGQLSPLSDRFGSEPSAVAPESIARKTCLAESHDARLQHYAAANPPGTRLWRRRRSLAPRQTLISGAQS